MFVNFSNLNMKIYVYLKFFVSWKFFRAESKKFSCPLAETLYKCLFLPISLLFKKQADEITDSKCFFLHTLLTKSFSLLCVHLLPVCNP